MEKSKGLKQRVFFQIIHLPVTWLIDYLSLIYLRFDRR